MLVSQARSALRDLMHLPIPLPSVLSTVIGKQDIKYHGHEVGTRVQEQVKHKSGYKQSLDDKETSCKMNKMSTILEINVGE